jgi:hypothetical protein
LETEEEEEGGREGGVKKEGGVYSKQKNSERGGP